MAEISSTNLVTMFFDRAAQYGSEPFLWHKVDGKYESLSWADVNTRVVALARGLLALGIEKGDRVVLVSENRPGWLVSDVAIMAAGGISTPAYTTNTSADHKHILEDSGAKGAIVSTPQVGREAYSWRQRQRYPAVHYRDGP